jgi:hypothetical protein
MRGLAAPGPVGRLQLWRFDRRLDRIWRRGQVEQVLSAVRARAGTTPVASARIVAADPVCMAEITWLDGFAVRLRSCHPGAVAGLARLLDDGRAVTVSRAVRSGPVWSLDFSLGDRSFPLLAGVITLAPGGGDGDRLVAPLVPQTA